MSYPKNIFTNYSSQIAGNGTYRDLQVASKTIFILRSHDLEIYTKMSGERAESILGVLHPPPPLGKFAPGHRDESQY